MKIKCNDHGKRVHVLPDATVLHRENGQHCPTDTIIVGDRSFTPVEVSTNTWDGERR